MLGFGKRVSYAFRCFFSLVSNGEIPAEIAPEVIPAQAASPIVAPPQITTPVPKVEKPQTESTDRAVQMLALLQRDGRLIDFFKEDIAHYQDAQIGAAVRELHENCRKVLQNYVKLEPIISSEEDRPITVESGFDPASIKFIGNVTGKAPLRGLLRHRGWRATEVNLPPLPSEAGRSIVAPAEVEIT